MTFTHHGLVVELCDDWWNEAQVANFVPATRAYRVDSDLFKTINEVRIEDIAPVCRNEGVQIFKDDAYNQIPARDRVSNILKGFRLNEAIPPVQIIQNPSGSIHQYRVYDGTHRLYCSLAVGFTHVPTINGIDWKTLDTRTHYLTR